VANFCSAKLDVMSRFLGTTIYFCGVILATLFFVGGGVVLVAQAGESPLFASAISLIFALLCYAFGWSGRRLLHGQA